jgi:hypothetical protein
MVTTGRRFERDRVCFVDDNLRKLDGRDEAGDRARHFALRRFQRAGLVADGKWIAYSKPDAARRTMFT